MVINISFLGKVFNWSRVVFKLVIIYLSNRTRNYNYIFIQRCFFEFIFWKSERLLLILRFVISIKFLSNFCITWLLPNHIFRKCIVVLFTEKEYSFILSIFRPLKFNQTVFVGIIMMPVAVKHRKLKRFRSLS